MFIIPGKAVLIAYPTVMALFPSGMQSGPGGNTAGTGAVCMVKDYALGSQAVKIGGFDIGVSHVAQAVSPELVRHD